MALHYFLAPCNSHTHSIRLILGKPPLEPALPLVVALGLLSQRLGPLLLRLLRLLRLLWLLWLLRLLRLLGRRLLLHWRRLSNRSRLLLLWRAKLGEARLRHDIGTVVPAKLSTIVWRPDGRGGRTALEARVIATIIRGATTRPIRVDRVTALVVRVGRAVGAVARGAPSCARPVRVHSV